MAVASYPAAAAHMPIDETLETNLANPYNDSSLGVASSDRLANTPDEYTFSADDGDTKKYILLKNVNASENDGFFVMTVGYSENGAP